MTELIKKGKILDKIYTIVGDEGTDIILNSKGNVKIRFGNSFLNLIKNGKISSEAISGYSSSGIKEVGDKSEITSDGIYFSKADKTFYISFGGIIFEINGKEIEDEDILPEEGDIDYTTENYLAINKRQKLTSEQLKYALSNLKLIVDTLSDNIQDIPDTYPIYVTEKERHYKKTNGQLQELYLNLNDGGTVKGSVTIGETSSNYPKSKLNIINPSPVTLFDGNSSSLRIQFSEGNIILIPNNSTYTKYVINTKGIGIGTTPTVPLEVLGNEIVRGILQVLNRIITEDIGSNIFVPGFTGEGFRIYKDDQGQYNAEFDNLTVRQTMRIYELILEKIRVVKGSLIISQGGSIVKSVDEMTIEFDDINENYIPTGEKITVQCYKITFDEEYIPFTKNDLVRCQVFQYPNVRGYWVWVREVDGNSIYVDKTEFSAPYSEPEVGDEICQLGNVVDPNRQSAIYLSASDTINPIIDILSDIKQKSFSGSIRCRLGNLNGITYGQNELKGHGLFGDNVYLKGKLITFGHDSNNSINIGDFYESNSINLSKVHELKLFFTDTFNQLIFYNGDFVPDEKRIIKNPYYKTPFMKDGEYEFDPSNKLNPTEEEVPMYLEMILNPPPAAPYKSIYNCTKDGITTCYLRDYEVSSDPSTPLIWRLITEYRNPKPENYDPSDPPEGFIDIDLLPIEIDLCRQLNLLGSNTDVGSGNTLFYSEYSNLPTTPYEVNDYWITTDNKIYISLASRIYTDSPIIDDWAERNLAQSSIREDVANKLGYDNYQDLMTWALKGNTIIEGGYINTRLLEAEIIIGNQLVEGPYMRSDKIEIRDPNDSNVTRWRLNAEAITGGIELVESSSIDGVTTIVERPHVKFLPDGTMYGLRRSDENDNPWRFNSDGSGSLALGNIKWDPDGKITFGDDVLGTVIDNGLITTGTIALGTGDTIFVANSGITGSIDQEGLSGDNLVRFWAGGTLDDARRTVLNNIKNTSLTPIAPYVVTQGGELYSTNAYISGVINATGGSIGRLQILNNGDSLSWNGKNLFESSLYITQSSSQTIVKLGSPGNKAASATITFGTDYIGTGSIELINTGVKRYGLSSAVYMQAPLIFTEWYGKGTPSPQTIFITDTDNETTIQPGMHGYIELYSAGNRQCRISLGSTNCIPGQILFLYNKNPWDTHRIEIRLMQGWFWLIEQSAAGFILTSEGWRLYKGTMSNY